jgi:hypothetical protein
VSKNLVAGAFLCDTDIQLLTHFIANSRSLRSNDHNWVPICMPDFNSKGYLQVCAFLVYLYENMIDVSRILSKLLFFQAYISNIPLSGKNAETPASPGGSSLPSSDELTVILMASSADPSVFKELLRGNKYLMQVSWCQNLGAVLRIRWFING